MTFLPLLPFRHVKKVDRAHTIFTCTHVSVSFFYLIVGIMMMRFYSYVHTRYSATCDVSFTSLSSLFFVRFPFFYIPFISFLPFSFLYDAFIHLWLHIIIKHPSCTFFPENEIMYLFVYEYEYDLSKKWKVCVHKFHWKSKWCVYLHPAHFCLYFTSYCPGITVFLHLFTHSCIYCLCAWYRIAHPIYSQSVG